MTQIGFSIELLPETLVIFEYCFLASILDYEITCSIQSYSKMYNEITVVQKRTAFWQDANCLCFAEDEDFS